MQYLNVKLRQQQETREKMHNEELDNLYSLPHSVKVKLKKNEMGWVCGTHDVTTRDAYTLF